MCGYSNNIFSTIWDNRQTFLLVSNLIVLYAGNFDFQCIVYEGKISWVV